MSQRDIRQIKSNSAFYGRPMQSDRLKTIRHFDCLSARQDWTGHWRHYPMPCRRMYYTAFNGRWPFLVPAVIVLRRRRHIENANWFSHRYYTARAAVGRSVGRRPTSYSVSTAIYRQFIADPKKTASLMSSDTEQVGIIGFGVIIVACMAPWKNENADDIFLILGYTLSL